MAHVYFGIGTVIICSIGFWFSFKEHAKSRDNQAVLLLVLFGFLLRVFPAADPFLHSWDERYHALVAKNLLHHFQEPTLYDNPILNYNYSNWTANHVWLHKQPLTLWLIAVSLKIFGLHPWAVRMPSVALSCVGIKLIYDIARHLYGRQVAFISAFLFAIHGMIVELAAGRDATDHVDVIFLFFVLAGVWCSIKYAATHLRRYIAFTGISLGAAVLTKWLPAVIILPLFAFLSLKNDPWKTILINSLIIIGVALILVAPWQYYILSHYPLEARWEYSYNSRHFFEPLEGQSGDLLYHFNYLRTSYGELIYLPILWFSFKTIKEKKPDNYAILLWFWLTYLFYTIAATKMPAYTLMAAPAIFIITACAFVSWRAAKYNTKLLRITVTVVTLGLIILPVRYSLERLKPLQLADEPEWQTKINEVRNSQLNGPKTVIFNFDHPTEMMFATNCVCYERKPDSLTIKQVQDKGYTTVVLNK